MANSVDAVIGSEAIKQVENLIAKLTLADAELIKISQSAINAGKGISNISTPSGLSSSVANVTALNTELTKQNTIINKLHSDLAKKAEQSRLSEIRLQQQREKAFDSFEKNANREQAIIDKNNNAYNKTQAQINKLTVAYNDLAIRKARYNNLNDNEEKRLVTLSAINEKYNGILKTTDATIGKNQRNVGNYASGFNALGNSINQLSREAPAFANSINTGFMAISNNIPALFDALEGIKRQNKSLAEEGKPTVSVLKQLAGAIFSWQTLLSVGVTLLTIYGGKIIDYAFGLNETQKAQKALNDEMSTAKNTITNEISQLQSLTAIVNDHNESSINRKLAYDEIKKTLPGLTSATYDQAVSTGELTRATDLYISSLIQKNIVEAEAKSIAESQTALNKTMATSTKERMGWSGKLVLAMSSDEKATLGAIKKIKDAEDKKLQDDIDRRKKALTSSQETFLKTQAQLKQYVTKPDKSASRAEEDKLKATAELRKKELELQLAQIDQLLNNEELYYTDRLTALDADFIKRTEIAKLDYDEEYRLSKGNQDKQKTALINFQLEKIKLIESYTKQKNTLEALDLDPITKLATSKLETNPLKQLAESGKNASKELEDSAKRSEELRIKIDELKKSTDNWLNSFSSEFLQNSGLGSLQTFFDGSFEKILQGADTTKEKFAVTFNAIAESAQEAFNFISNASQANFDNEYSRLESQKEVALKFAGDSANARTKIEEDAEKKKKEIANRENKAKQKQAIFNIAIDTAQGIVSALASTPPNIPLSIAIGVIGAVQLGLVASQKVPQYFDGTDNHIGGMMLVNDGGGSNYQEKVILPNGKEIMPEGRNVLMNAPKGTKVLTHEQQIMQMLNERGISMHSSHNQNNGMTAQEMDSVMAKHFSKIQTNVTNIDQNGFRTWSESNGNKTIKNNNRVSRTGYSV